MIESSGQLKGEQSGKKSRKIVVTGPCGYEVAGVMALLSESGCPVYHAGAKTVGAGDLLIVALSACPELGWWKEQIRLRRQRQAGRYRMVALVPGSLEKVVSRQGICPVVSGDEPTTVLREHLSAEVRTWREGRPAHEMVCTDILPAQQMRALAVLMSGTVVRRKAEYCHRYLGLARLGFHSGPQYQRYHSGPEA
ncbi:hypothetical protein DTR82_17605 [Salmonella enterica subsp. enterica serovar Javiana]|nr:hypothetical protein [Salmonella enterica subsp. enterica serovar Javiana]